MTPDAQSPPVSSAEAEIRRLIAAQQQAIRAKDVDRIMALYAPDVVFYDVKPPFQTVGSAAFRRIWAECLPCFPDTFDVETRDLHVRVSGDLAFAHWLFRFTGPQTDHPALQQWLRITSVAERRAGRWQVVHEHVSVPFDPYSGKAVLTLDI